MTHLRVSVKISSDDAFELKAQALNNDPRLKAAGIAALKFVGDKKYIVDGDFSPELPPPDTGETPTTDSNIGGDLHVFVRIATDDSYELQAQALNQNPLLKKAGIASLRRVGDKQYIVDGEFTGALPASRQPGLETPASLPVEKLRVTIRMQNDDAYQLMADHLNGEPRLQKAGISEIELVQGQKMGTAEAPFLVEPVVQVSNQPHPVPAPVTTKKKRKLSGCLAWAMALGVVGILAVGGVYAAYTYLPGLFSPAPAAVLSPTPELAVIPPAPESTVIPPTPELMTFDNVCSQVGQQIELEGIVEIFCGSDSCDTHYVELIDVDRDGFMAIGLNIKEGEYDPAPNYMADLPVSWETSDFLVRAVDGQLIGEDDLVRITGTVTSPLPGRPSGPEMDCSVDEISKIERINHPTLPATENLTQSTLRDAIIKGWVIATITGTESYLTIDINLESQVDFDLEISIGPGTLFEAQSEGVQNMVARSGTVAVLRPQAEAFFRLEAVCVNMELETPSESDTFLVGQGAISDDLMTLINLPEFRFESHRVQQYAVWTITENPGRCGYYELEDLFDVFSGPTNDEVERNLSLFQRTGIDISQYQVFSHPPVPQAQQFFTEEFDNPLSCDWYAYTVTGSDQADADKVTVEARDGRLVWDFDSEEVYFYLFYDAFRYEDVRLEVRAENLGRNANSISLVCRYDPDAGWYEFNIGNDGLYNIQYVEVASDDRIVYNALAEGGSSAINVGTAVNEYSISCIGEELTLFINGDEVNSIIENKYGLREGQIGISVSSYDVLPILIEMDRVTISEP
jgi:hypothetical protein